MDKSNLELFKQALDEAVSNKFDNMAANCTEEIVCSERHKLAMQAIVYGKGDTKRTWSPRMKRIIAILVAAALLLTSCGIIFSNQISEVFKELFASITFEGDESKTNTIEDIYQLEYVPDGYSLEEENISPLSVVYKFVDKKGNIIKFKQSVLNNIDFVIDSEKGYSEIIDIEKYDVYYRYTDTYHCYIWNDSKYALKLKSNIPLSNETILLIIEGLVIE